MTVGWISDLVSAVDCDNERPGTPCPEAAALRALGCAPGEFRGHAQLAESDFANAGDAPLEVDLACANGNCFCDNDFRGRVIRGLVKRCGAAAYRRDRDQKAWQHTCSTDASRLHQLHAATQESSMLLWGKSEGRVEADEVLCGNVLLIDVLQQAT
jgi:hypothetical protein